MKLHVIALLLLAPVAAYGQVRANSPELKLYEQIDAETNPDAKLQLIHSFETQFPNSKILARIYLLAVDVYRGKQDRTNVNEYAEKTLQLDGTNVTAMMLLARNYAIEAKNLDRAIELAQRALKRVEQLRQDPLPVGYSAAQWNDYLKNNSESAEQILDYVTSIKRRAESLKSSAANGGTAEATATDASSQKR
jgi:hypothetical protein